MPYVSCCEADGYCNLMAFCSSWCENTARYFVGLSKAAISDACTMGNWPRSSSEKAVNERNWRLIGFRLSLIALGFLFGGWAEASESSVSLSDSRRASCDLFRLRICSWTVALLRSALLVFSPTLCAPELERSSKQCSGTRSSLYLMSRAQSLFWWNLGQAVLVWNPFSVWD